MVGLNLPECIRSGNGVAELKQSLAKLETGDVRRYLEILSRVKAEVRLLIAVKLSPFFSSLANMARTLVDAGADGLVLFNRFYQPDINPEAKCVSPNILLSTPMAMRCVGSLFSVPGSGQIWPRPGGSIVRPMSLKCSWPVQT
jgi:hypothetical protein